MAIEQSEIQLAVLHADAEDFDVCRSGDLTQPLSKRSDYNVIVWGGLTSIKIAGLLLTSWRAAGKGGGAPNQGNSEAI